MRIIGGKYKGRKLHTPNSNHIRPTSDRLRESLFNILSHNARGFENLCVIDIFAGTGSQGLEALSRGAKKCIFVEKDLRSLALLKANIQLLDNRSDAVILQQDATKLGLSPEQHKKAIELAFLDAPFEQAQQLTQKTLKALYKGEWLADNAWVVIKFPAKKELEILEEFCLIRKIKAGNSQALILTLK